jgi:hypothetical protein
MTQLNRAVLTLRGRRRVFFHGPDHKPTADFLLLFLLEDAITANAFPMQVDFHANWWIFAAKNDWILDDNPGTATETFFTLVPYPKKGVPHIHTPILVTAFAEKVVTFSSGVMELINAEADEVGEIEAYCKAKYSDLRVVAFVFNEEEWQNAPLKDFT